MNNLIIFDIDGTLIDYIHCEDKAYIEAVSTVTGITPISTAWDLYKYSTEKAWKREARAAEPAIATQRVALSQRASFACHAL